MLEIYSLNKFKININESNLTIQAKKDLSALALTRLNQYREQLNDYIDIDPHFAQTYSSHKASSRAPAIVRSMSSASQKCKVGPMAAVAGALAQFVGREILTQSDEVVVQNNHDFFLSLKTKQKFRLNSQLALELDAQREPFALATTSGQRDNIFSFGKADLVVVVASDASLADAAATAIGNLVVEKTDIKVGLKLAKKISNLGGVLIIKDDQVGLQGKINLTAA